MSQSIITTNIHKNIINKLCLTEQILLLLLVSCFWLITKDKPHKFTKHYKNNLLIGYWYVFKRNSSGLWVDCQSMMSVKVELESESWKWKWGVVGSRGWKMALHQSCVVSQPHRITIPLYHVHVHVARFIRSQPSISLYYISVLHIYLNDKKLWITYMQQW